MARHPVRFLGRVDHMLLHARQVVVRAPLRLPNFLVIGAQKSGTSWLYMVLREHPLTLYAACPALDRA